jgi:hypothetical protein
MKLSNVDWYSIYKKWTINSGVFEYLFKSSPFVSGKYIENFELNLNKHYSISHELKEILKENVEKDRIIIADLDGILGINTAIALNNEFRVSPILSYNFLFHPYGIVGDNSILEALIGAAKIIKPISPITHAFILDKNRYFNDLNINNSMLFNNQYEITEEEMPDIDMLRRLNKKAVSFLYDKIIKEDIKCYLEHLRLNNFIVDTMDIGEIVNG